MNALPTLIDWQPISPAVALEEAFASANEYLKAEKSDATRLAYASDARSFTAWCHLHGLCPLPATVDAVGGYLASLADAGPESVHNHPQSRCNPLCAPIRGFGASDQL